MSDDGRYRNTAFLDDTKARTAVGVAVALVLWCAALLLVGRMLTTPVTKPPPPANLDAQLVELEPPPQPRASTPELPAAPAHSTPPARIVHTPRAAPPPLQHMRPAHEVPPERHAAPALAAAPSTVPAVPSPAPAATVPPPSPGASANHEPAAADATAHSGGHTGARAIVQPLPEIPDDLRELAYHAIALAHFTIHRDGSADVELVQPTQNPRLNQLLLASLHNWRFFPATENGEPVESHLDIRVHLVVQ